MDYKKEISETCQQLKYLLIRKNEQYGNSVFEPVRIFSKADTVEQIKVRIDDKLSRIKNQDIIDMNNLIDLIGYLIILKIKTE